MSRRPANQRGGRPAAPAAPASSETSPSPEVAEGTEVAEAAEAAGTTEAPGTGGSPVVPPQRLALDGELTIQTAAERRGTLLAALEAFTGPGAPEHGPVELDLSEVSELDTAGVQLLLVAQREVESLGRSLRIVGAHTAVSEVLAIAHLTELLAGEPVAIREESFR